MTQITTAEGVVIEYDTFGAATDPALLVVMGLGTQLIGWPPEFCECLAEAGRFVIRYDNRDCGLSTKFDDRPVDLGAVIDAAWAGDLDRARELAPYSLSEMAADGLGLLTALGIERAHVVGSSLGGMIAQTMAIEHPERLLTLTSMMSTTGEPEFGQSTPEAMAALLTPSPSDRDGYIEAARNSLVWASKKYADLAALRELAARAYDRCYCPEGVSRQLAAVITGGSRADAIAEVAGPHAGDPRPRRHADRAERRRTDRCTGARCPVAPPRGHGP